MVLRVREEANICHIDRFYKQMMRNIFKESIGKHNQLFCLETIGFSYGLHLLVKSFLDGKMALLSY